MATNNDSGTSRNLWLAGAASLALVAGLALAWYLRPPPQMGTDEEVFRTVDALFTAVTGRNEQGLTQCEERLHACRDVGKLPPAAAKRLDTVIHQCRAGNWEPAAQQLYTFIQAQRGAS